MPGPGIGTGPWRNRRRAASAGGAPAVANQSVVFGRLTFAGAGAAALANTGAAMSAATLATDDATNPGHWSVSSTGRITPTAAYRTGPQAASYTLVVSPGSGAPNATITITTEADVYDWASQADWDQIAVLSAATLSAKTIKARPNIPGVITSGVDGTAARFRRADYGNLLITSRDFTSRPVFDRFQLSGTINLILEGIATELTTAQKITLVASASWPVSGVIIRNNVLSGMPFDTATFDWAGTTPPNPDIVAFSGPAANFTGCQILNNDISWCRNGINAFQGGGSAPLVISGNRISMIAGGDAIKVSYGGNANQAVVEDNVIFGFLSRGTDFGNPHQDGIQFAGSGSATTDFAIKVNRNIIWNGQRGQPQGIFADDQGTGGNFLFTGECNGNLVVLNTTHAISILRARDFLAVGNTAVSDVTSGASAGGVKVGAGSASAFTSGTHMLTRNLSDGFTTGGTPTLTDNITLGVGGATISYASVFDGGGGGVWIPASRANALAWFSRKAGGAADLPSGLDAGAVGSGYVNWPSTSPGSDGSFNASDPPASLTNTRSVQFPARNGDGAGRALTGSQLVNMFGNSTTAAAGAFAFRLRIQPGGLNTTPAATNQTAAMIVGGTSGQTGTRALHCGYAAGNNAATGLRNRFYWLARDQGNNHAGEIDSTGTVTTVASSRFLRTAPITPNVQGSWTGLVIMRRNAAGLFEALTVTDDGTVTVGDGFTPAAWVGQNLTTGAMVLGSIPAAAATFGNWFNGDMCDFIQLDGTHGTNAEWQSVALGADPATVWGGNLAAHFRLSGTGDLTRTAGTRSYVAFSETTSGSPAAFADGPQLRPARNILGNALLARPQFRGYVHALPSSAVRTAANRAAVAALTGTVVRDLVITGAATHVQGRALTTGGTQLVGWTRVTASAATGIVETSLPGVRCGEVILEYRREDDNAVVSVVCDRERVGIVAALIGQSQTVIAMGEAQATALNVAPNTSTAVSYCWMRGSAVEFNPPDGGFLNARNQLSEGMNAAAQMLDALGSDIPVEFMCVAAAGTSMLQLMYRYNGAGLDMCGDGTTNSSGMLTAMMLAKRKRVTTWLYSWSTDEASTRNGGSATIGATVYGARGPLTEESWISRMNELFGGVAKASAGAPEQTERQNLHKLGFAAAWNPWVIMLPVSRHRSNGAGAAPADSTYGAFRLQQYDAAINGTGKAGNWDISLGAFQIDTFMTPESETAHQARTDVRGNIRFATRYAQALGFAARLSTLDPRPQLTTASGVTTSVITISTNLVNGGSLVTQTDATTIEEFEVSENSGAWSRRDGAIPFTPAISGNTVTLTRGSGTWAANTRIRYLNGWPVAVGGSGGMAATEGTRLNGVLYETRTDAIASGLTGLRAGVPLMPTWTDITAT